MKSILALSTLGVAAVLSFTVACDNEGSAVSCTTDADCANETDNTTCDTDVGVCVAPAEDVCADATDCDLANSDTPSEAKDCSGDGDCGADEVCVADGVGTTYCVLADDGTTACADIDATFTTVTVDGKDVCVVDAGQDCTEGQCVDA